MEWPEDQACCLYLVRGDYFLTQPKGIIVAVSGGGRSLENLIEYAKLHKSFVIKGVISSNPKCGAVHIAEKHSIPMQVHAFRNAEIQDPTFIDALNVWCSRAELICLAGFIKKFPLLPRFHRSMINIHPALLPKYGGRGMYGVRVHRAVLQNHERESGVSVHFVDDEYDTGPIIAQSRVEVWPDDTEQSLADRVFSSEKRILPRVIEGLLNGELPLQNKQIKIYEW